MERRQAILIDRPEHLRKYKVLCKENGIFVSLPVSKPVFPHYQMLMTIGRTTYSLYNDSLEGSSSSVIEMNYVPYPWSDAKELISNFLLKEEV